MWPPRTERLFLNSSEVIKMMFVDFGEEYLPCRSLQAIRLVKLDLYLDFGVPPSLLPSQLYTAAYSLCNVLLSLEA